MNVGGSISIWFFIGVSFLFNGAVILAAGLYELVYPPEFKVTLYGLHASIWWGGLLTLLGLYYCLRYSPKRTRA
jgi:hypothetical protein